MNQTSSSDPEKNKRPKTEIQKQSDHDDMNLNPDTETSNASISTSTGKPQGGSFISSKEPFSDPDVDMGSRKQKEEIKEVKKEPEDGSVEFWTLVLKGCKLMKITSQRCAEMFAENALTRAHFKNMDKTLLMSLGVILGDALSIEDAIKNYSNKGRTRQLSKSGIDALVFLVKETLGNDDPFNFMWLGPPDGWEKKFRGDNPFWGKMAPPCSRRIRRQGENPNAVDLLFSEHLVLNKGPFDILRALGPHQFRLLKGPSGCGKTRAILETGQHRYVLLLDFSQEPVSEGTRFRDPSVELLCSDLSQIYRERMSVISKDNLARYDLGIIRILIELFARLLFLLFLSQNTAVTPKLFLDSQYDGGQDFVQRAIVVFRQFSFWSNLQELVQLIRECFAELKKKGIDNVIVAVDEASVPKALLNMEVLTQRSAELCVSRGVPAYDMHGILLPEFQRGELGLINGALFHIADLTSTVFASTMTLEKEDMSATAIAKGLDVQVISDFSPFSSEDVFDYLVLFLNLPAGDLKRIASGLAGRIRWSEEFVRRLIHSPADPFKVLETTLDFLTREKIPQELDSAKLHAHARRLLTRMVVCFEKLHSSSYFVASEAEGKLLQNFVAFTRKRTDALVEYRIVDPVVARGCLNWLQSKTDKESLVSRIALQDFCDTLQPMLEAGKGERFEDVVIADLHTLISKQGINTVQKLVDRIEPGLGDQLTQAFASKSLAFSGVESHSDCKSDLDFLRQRPLETLIKPCHMTGPDAVLFVDKETSISVSAKIYSSAVSTDRNFRNLQTTDVNNLFLGKDGVATQATESFRKQVQDILKDKPIRMQIRLNIILPRSQKPHDLSLQTQFSSHVTDLGNSVILWVSLQNASSFFCAKTAEVLEYVFDSAPDAKTQAESEAKLSSTAYASATTSSKKRPLTTNRMRCCLCQREFSKSSSSNMKSHDQIHVNDGQPFPPGVNTYFVAVD